MLLQTMSKRGKEEVVDVLDDSDVEDPALPNKRQRAYDSRGPIPSLNELVDDLDTSLLQRTGRRRTYFTPFTKSPL